MAIQHIDRTLSGATTPGQSGPKSNDDKGVHIPQISKAGALLSDGLSYPGHLLKRGSYLSAGIQSV